MQRRGKSRLDQSDFPVSLRDLLFDGHSRYESRKMTESSTLASLYTLTSMVLTFSLTIFFANRLMSWYRAKGVSVLAQTRLRVLAPVLDTLFLEQKDIVKASLKDKNLDSGKIEGHRLDNKYISLAFCTIGLQVSYLTWGYLQEKIMTQDYDGQNFTSSRLLVLFNRLMSVILALIYMLLYPQPFHRAPALEYSYCSVTNVLSSFCQYEALQYISFPLQTVAKACKIIPTMIMGKLVQNKTYDVNDYIGAAIISFGVALFSYLKNRKTDFASSSFEKVESNGATLTGIFLLISYLTFDSFTSNWQSRLFQKYQLTPIQVMLGLNVFAAIFSLSSLLQTGEAVESLLFVLSHPSCGYDCFIMSTFSAIGQLFIYRTISIHGVVAFTIISVTRQLLSVVLSSVMFGHEIKFEAWIAAIITFSGILYKNFAKSLFKSNTTKKLA